MTWPCLSTWRPASCISHWCTTSERDRTGRRRSHNPQGTGGRPRPPADRDGGRGRKNPGRTSGAAVPSARLAGRFLLHALGAVCEGREEREGGREEGREGREGEGGQPLLQTSINTNEHTHKHLHTPSTATHPQQPHILTSSPPSTATHPHKLTSHTPSAATHPHKLTSHTPSQAHHCVQLVHASLLALEQFAILVPRVERVV